VTGAPASLLTRRRAPPIEQGPPTGSALALPAHVGGNRTAHGPGLKRTTGKSPSVLITLEVERPCSPLLRAAALPRFSVTLRAGQNQRGVRPWPHEDLLFAGLVNRFEVLMTWH
jgi:hypothetical protein